jgi:HEAT repeat protein
MSKVFLTHPIRMRFKYVALCFLLVQLAACCEADKISQNIQSLQHASPKVRNQAALDLAGCGERASKAVPLLGTLLYDENVGVQSSAAYALRKIDTPQARALIDAAVARKNAGRKTP